MRDTQDAILQVTGTMRQWSPSEAISMWERIRVRAKLEYRPLAEIVAYTVAFLVCDIPPPLSPVITLTTVLALALTRICLILCRLHVFLFHSCVKFWFELIHTMMCLIAGCVSFFFLGRTSQR